MSLAVCAEPETHRPHFTHSPERIWPETNCYFDLWIELLHALGLDPVPSFASALSADHDGMHWSFLKPLPEDLRRLYGLEVTEENVWMPVLETVESGPPRGVLHTVEVDSWWLPDTAGTSYRTEHVKTTIVPTRVDRDRKLMWYLHNAGLYELRNDDFDGVFGETDPSATVLLPYIEAIRRFPDRREDDALLRITTEHLSRRPDGNPVERLADGLGRAAEWLPSAGMPRFHRWAFANLRQCGATAELAADFAVHLDGVRPGTAHAEGHFRAVASGAKSVQFKMARLANGRSVDVGAGLAEMARDWQTAMDSLAAAVG
ncbi:DUF1839 family protein [Mycobacterium sp. DL592]|uniref:DUF1839 family protein n=1 Tax=Mycobacterium sp. DL592 TaxID=2675524 RepID=UPI0014242A6D|nr:DUF1839 family protein [Mycobacterium sp. DL592]